MKHVRVATALVGPGYDFQAAINTLRAVQRASTSLVEATCVPASLLLPLAGGGGGEGVGMQFIRILDPSFGTHFRTEEPYDA